MVCGSGAPHAFPRGDDQGDEHGDGPTHAGLTAPDAPLPPLPPQQTGAYPPLPQSAGGYPPPPPSGAYPIAMPPPPNDRPPNERPRRGGVALIALSGVLVLVLIAAVVAVVVLTRDDSTSEVTLEPVDMVAADAFADNFDHDTEAGKAYADLDLADAPDERFEQVDSSLSGRGANGTDPGLYGGSRDTQVCDVEALVEFLAASENEDKASVWAETLDIEVGEIEDYLGTLTAVRLRWDTRVTNHGFTDGEANAYQSLLQAGTAVLVDDEGVPRVKCNCGNPLLEPESLGGDVEESSALDVDEIAANPDAAWDRLDPAQVVTVLGGEDAVEEITIVDVDTGGLLDRPVGSDGVSKRDTGTGDVQLTLEWESDADLDLSVVEPNGEEIYHANRGPTSTGGELDVDANISCDNDGSLENIYWPDSEAPSGEYTVAVNGYQLEAGGASCGSGDYTLTITIGDEERVETGTVAEGDSDEYTFDVP